MQEQDKPQFAEGMTALSLVFGKEVTKPLARAYFMALQEYPINNVLSAIDNHVKNGKFFPKPIELADIINTGKPNNNDKALLAWLSIERAISKLGPYRTLELNDRLAMEIIKHVGGWSNLCSLTTKELDFKKRDFIQAYTTTAITDDKDLPKSLAGCMMFRS